MKVLMHALAASCEELRARTGNPPLEKNNRITEYSAQIKSGFASEFDPQLTQKSSHCSKVKLRWA